MHHQVKENFRRAFFASAFVAMLLWAGAVCAQTTAFTYQGVLNDGATPANNNYDMKFKLFDAASGGVQIGATVSNPTVKVSNGVFTVQLDFGASAFPGAARFLEIGFRLAGNAGPYSISPRTQITSTPYAIRALNSTQLNGLDSTKILQADTNGNVGVGTTSPTSKLDVRGNMTLDSGASPVLYTGTANTDLGRYLQLINSPSAPSSSGLKAGGLLVADSYSFANPGQNDLIVKGNIGIGTTSPQSKLHVFGSSGAFTPFRGLTIDQIINANTSGYAMKVTTTSSGVIRSATGTSFLIDSSGNVGVGTDSPAARLHVSGGTAAFDGNVGIGTSSPTSTSKLEIAAQDGLRITGFQPFLTLRDTNAVNRSSFVQGVDGNLVLLTNSRASLVLKDDGHVSLNVLEILGGADLAENFEVDSANLVAGIKGLNEVKTGLLVSIDPSHTGRLVVSSRAYDRRVAGIISGAGGINAGMVMGQTVTASEGRRPIALSGRVYCWADAANGPIRPGDLLTTSGRPGYAMRVTNQARARGAIIGKAMTSLKSGSGLVLVLVMLQ